MVSRHNATLTPITDLLFQRQKILQFGHSSHDNFFNSIFVHIRRKFKDATVWSFLEFLKILPIGRFLPEILNLYELRKNFAKTQLPGSQTGTKWTKYSINFKEIFEIDRFLWNWENNNAIRLIAAISLSHCLTIWAISDLPWYMKQIETILLP